jgi:hypothetical protein
MFSLKLSCYITHFHLPAIVRLPDDIWLVDLDSNKITPPSGSAEDFPNLPEPEGTILKNHLKQVSPSCRLDWLESNFIL